MNDKLAKLNYGIQDWLIIFRNKKTKPCSFYHGGDDECYKG